MKGATPTDDSGLTRRRADFDTIVDALEYAAKGCRGLNFYSSRGELDVSLTYVEIRERAEDIGRRLVGMGFEKGSRLALIAETTPDFICHFLGAQYASVLPVPLPLPTSFGGRDGYVEQLKRQLQSCQASAIISPASMAEILGEAIVDLNLRFAGTADEFLATAQDIGDVRLPSSDDLTYLQYSSGSTRFPHGISIAHDALMANAHGMGHDGVQIREGDRCVSWLPFYHDMGLVGTFLTTMACQVSADYLATEDFARRPLMWLSLMSRNKGTVTYGPTFGYDICARRVGPDALAALDLSGWRVAGIGGDMIRPEVMKNFADIFSPVGFKPEVFVPSYGLAECTLAVSFMPLGKGILTDQVDERVLSGEISTEGAVAYDPNSDINGHQGLHGLNGYAQLRDVVNCGKLLPGFEIEIRSPEGDVLDEPQMGRVYLKGISIMREYFNDPEATKQVLSTDGWLDSGDMGYMRDDHIFIVGRAKDMIIVNGCNHWPQDIEWAAEQLDGVRSGDVAAVSIPGGDAEEVPLVLVQCRLRDHEKRNELSETVRAEVMRATGIQCQVELVPPRALPRTSSGKLSRAKARAQFLSGEFQITSD